MSYVIYNKETTRLFNDFRYGSMTSAKGALTKAANKGKINADEWAIAEKDHFAANIEKWVVRKNIMTGESYKERINTPPFLSPACESFWSM